MTLFTTLVTDCLFGRAVLFLVTPFTQCEYFIYLIGCHCSAAHLKVVGCLLISKPSIYRWIAIITEFRELAQLMIPRIHFLPNQSGTVTDNMFVFANATKAHRAVIYLNRNDHINFTMSKIHVAPNKNICLPRLELMAAVIVTTFNPQSLIINK